jgi:hypothetical protein
MDTRFLILDLNIELKSEDDQDEEPDDPNDPETGDLDMADLTEDDLEILPPESQGSKVRVSVDEIARPGAMVNGRVTFPDGQSGAWYVDEMGRLGIDPDTAGYRPSEADLISFQRELQAAMEHR